jgi:exonuclease SbcD
MIKILHTSDWHLGRTLYSKKERVVEHNAFLNWLLDTIKEHHVNVLLVAGDVFDTSAPSAASQKMYYDFLLKVKLAGCDHVVVVGGNHDSPSFLNAPKDILAALDVHVIGNATENIEDEIVVLNDNQGNPALMVCGVPFLRERDISRFVEGENYSDRSKRINECIKRHYHEVAVLAKSKRESLGTEIPIMATGHLSVAGGKRNDDDGVRETYIGNIEAVGGDIFPDVFDYVALGHYHIPSKIAEHIRYCGSPIPMGFGEAGQEKCVYIIDFDKQRNIETINIPVFQRLKSVKGDKNQIEQELKAMIKEDVSLWAEVLHTGNDLFPDLHTWVNDMVANSKVEVLKVQNKKLLSEVLTKGDTSKALNDLDVFEVFDNLLLKEQIPEEQKNELKKSYKEIVDGINIKE